MMPSGAIASGMAGVESRIASIQSRLQEVVGGPGRTAAVFTLPDRREVVDLTPPTGLTRTETAAQAPPATSLVERPLERPVAVAESEAAAPVGAAPGAVGAAPALAPTATSASLAAKLPAAAGQWLPAIEQAALAAGIEPALLAALVRHESNFDQSVVSHAGAIGLAQLMPGTAAWLKVDPYDPIQNLNGGARYLKEQLNRFGSVDLALAAYNAGPNRVAQAGGAVPRIPETLAYVPRVISTWEQLR